MKTFARMAAGAFAIALGVGGCTDVADDRPGDLLPYYADESFQPYWFSSRDEVPESFHSIPDFTLLNQDGNVVTAADFEGKLYVANFFFTSCPGICPTTMGNMARLQGEVAALDDVVLLSHSVTPEADSVEALARFADEVGVLSTTWTLATGDREMIYDLGKNYYFTHEDLGEPVTGADARLGDDFLHTESFILVDQDRHVRGVYNGMNRAAVDQLIADIHLLRGAGGP